MSAKEQAEKFFIGLNKYVKSTKDTNVYLQPGDSPIRVVPATDTIGKVIGVNEKGNWLKLDTGEWIVTSNSMFTVILDTPPPTGVINAVTREAERAIQYLGIDKILWTVLIVAVLIIVLTLFIKLKQ